MKRPHKTRLFVVAFGCVAGWALAAETNITLTLPPGVRLVHEHRAQPPQEIFVVTVDLKQPHLAVRVAAGGPDPDGPGAYQTTLMTVRAIADREDFDVAVNGDFFSAKKTVDTKGKKSGYLPGLWAKVSGAALTDGRWWARGTEPALWFSRDHRAGIGSGKIPPDSWQAISGHPLLVEESRAVSTTNNAVHPRTAVGVDATGTKLVLLVVDGRHPEVATGMTYAEIARELLRLGCLAAVNLDGGGSTTLVMRDATSGQRRVINTPSDGRERPVANVLGIRCRPPTPK